MDTVDTPREHHWSLTLLGIALIILFAYFGESVLAVLFFAILLSFVLSPLVAGLGALPPSASHGSPDRMILLLAVLYGITCRVLQPEAIDLCR